jgi:hypothetical protein
MIPDLSAWSTLLQSREQLILKLAGNDYIPVVTDYFGASFTMPNAADFSGPIRPRTNLSSLQGLGSTSWLDSQGII